MRKEDAIEAILRSSMLQKPLHGISMVVKTTLKCMENERRKDEVSGWKSTEYFEPEARR